MFLEFGLYNSSSWEIRRPLPVCGKRHLKSLLCLIEVAWVGVLAQGEVLKPSPDSGEGIPSFNDFCHRSKGNKRSVIAGRRKTSYINMHMWNLKKKVIWTNPFVGIERQT